MSAGESQGLVAGVSSQPGAVRLWAIATVAGVFAGLVSWLGGEAAVDYVQPELFKQSLQQLVRMMPSPESLEAAEIKNAHIAFAILGGVLGMTLGFAGGLIRTNAKAASKAGLIGLALGTGVGFGASTVFVPLYFRYVDPISTSLILPLLTHASVWSAIGAAAGLAFAIGLGGRRRLALGLLGGLIGGFLGAGIFEMVATAAFPFDRTSQPVSISAWSRLTARMSVCLCVSLLVAATTKICLPRLRRPPANVD